MAARTAVEGAPMHLHPLDLELAVAQRDLAAERWAQERVLLRLARSAGPTGPDQPPTWHQLLVDTGAAVGAATLDPGRSDILRDVVAELCRMAADAGVDTGVPAPVDGEVAVVACRRLGRLAERTARRTVPVGGRRAARVQALLSQLVVADSPQRDLGGLPVAARWRSVVDRLSRRHRPAPVWPRCP